MLNNIVGLLSIGGGVANSYESIMTANGTGSSGTISFTSIPSTYKHLQIRAVAQSSHTVTVAATYRLNGNNTIGNYSTHILDGNGSSASAYGASGDWPQGTAPSSTTSAYSALIIDILDYTNTNKYKTIRSLSGWDGNGSGLVRFSSGAMYSNTNAVTQFDIVLSTGNFSTASQFALYGIKG